MTPDADPSQIAVSSIEGYGAPIIDIMHWWLGSPLTSVVGAMRNLVSDFVDEITDPARPAQGDLAQGALVQETINAFEESFRRRAWVDFPLDQGGAPA